MLVRTYTHTVHGDIKHTHPHLMLAQGSGPPGGHEESKKANFGIYVYVYVYKVHMWIVRKARENGSGNRFLSRVRSAAKRECEP